MDPMVPGAARRAREHDQWLRRAACGVKLRARPANRALQDMIEDRSDSRTCGQKLLLQVRAPLAARGRTSATSSHPALTLPYAWRMMVAMPGEQLAMPPDPPQRMIQSTTQDVGPTLTGGFGLPGIEFEEALPTNIGRFPVQKRLGRGGMGEVFLAYDDTLSRNVAVKRIRPDLAADESIRHRFEIEARVTSILQHPAIVPVYHYAREDENFYYTMRPIEGMTLRALLEDLRRDASRGQADWPVARMVRLFLQVANAVAYAHAQGVIHRDLKPGNIMIGPFEEVLVLDWGMARVIRDADELRRPRIPAPLRELTANTSSGTIVGTPAYMAPEQLRGEPASFASDVFALGVVLYEILALRLPWPVQSVDDLLASVHSLPDSPERVQPGRGISHELGRAVIRALELDPMNRFASVAEFSREVAHALEGRGSWRPDSASGVDDHWQISSGRFSRQDEELFLRSRGVGGRFIFASSSRFTTGVRFELEMNVGPGPHELAVFLSPNLPRDSGIGDGYLLEVLPGKRRTLSLRRAGRVVAGAKSPLYAPHRWHSCTIVSEADRFSLEIDGEEVYAYHDPIPLSWGHVGLTGLSDGIRLRKLKVASRGSDATVSCLAVPDAFFNRRLFEDARVEYERIAMSHPGRTEGRIAAFREGLCFLEMAKVKADEDIRHLLLEEADRVFARVARQDDNCLAALGRAMVAGERNSLREKHLALLKAFRNYPDDPHAAVVREWLLGRLHSLGAKDRRRLAELLPLAIDHCMGGWGSTVVLDLLQAVRNAEWEFPSFLISRGHFKQQDPASRAETKLFFAFWAGAAESVAKVADELASGDGLRCHHLNDFIFGLLELEQAALARLAFPALERKLHLDLNAERTRNLCLAAIHAGCGDHEMGKDLLTRCDPHPRDRTFNSARLTVARALFDAGSAAGALKALRALGPEDSFAREQLAWFHLALGDARQADKQLKVFLERGDHKTGKNLTNFLHGACLALKGHSEEARSVFSLLSPVAWPRTWTLGSHYAAGRLGGGSLETYLAGAFPWEQKNLKRQLALLLKVGWKGQPSILADLQTKC